MEIHALMPYGDVLLLCLVEGKLVIDHPEASPTSHIESTDDVADAAPAE